MHVFISKVIEDYIFWDAEITILSIQGFNSYVHHLVSLYWTLKNRMMSQFIGKRTTASHELWSFKHSWRRSGTDEGIWW